MFCVMNGSVLTIAVCKPGNIIWCKYNGFEYWDISFCVLDDILENFRYLSWLSQSNSHENANIVVYI